MSDERKTPEQPRKLSGQMNELERLRHSCAHFSVVSLFILVLTTTFAWAHSDPRGDIYPDVKAVDQNFVIEFANNEEDGSFEHRPVLRMVYSTDGVLLSPRHVHGGTRDLDEELGYPAKLEAHLPDETIIFERGMSAKPGYSLKKAGKEELHHLPWPEDYAGRFEEGCADKTSIGIATINDQNLFLSHFDRNSFKLPETIQITQPNTLSFIWDFPVVSNVVRIGARYCIAWPRYNEAAKKFECVISTWKPGEDKPKEIILAEPADWNSHLSLAAIGNRLCLAYHCLTGSFSPVSKIFVVFRTITDDGPV